MPSATWPLGWLAGDVVSAAEYRKSMGAIYDSTASIAVASFDITPIVASYAHLRIVLYARFDTAIAVDTAVIRFNNDSGANYYREFLSGANAAVSTTPSVGQTSGWVLNIPGASADANIFDGGEIVIPHYAGTTGHKVFHAIGGASTSTTAATQQANVAHGRWASAAAINRITILPATGNFVAGSRCTVYVMGA